MKTLMALGLVAVSLGSLSGCATTIVHEDRYAESEGWRKGTVVEIGPAKDLKR